MQVGISHTGGLKNPFTKWDAPPKWLNLYDITRAFVLSGRAGRFRFLLRTGFHLLRLDPPWGGTLNVYWSLLIHMGYGSSHWVWFGTQTIPHFAKLEGYGISCWPIPKWPILRCIAGQNRKWSRELGKSWWERTCGYSCAALEVVHWNWPQKLRYPAIIVHLAPYRFRETAYVQERFCSRICGRSHLVGGFKPSEKYARQLGLFFPLITIYSGFSH